MAWLRVRDHALVLTHGDLPDRVDLPAGVSAFPLFQDYP